MKALPVVLALVVLAVAGGLGWLVVSSGDSDTNPGDVRIADIRDGAQPARDRASANTSDDAPTTPAPARRKAPREPEPPLPEPPAEAKPGEGARLLIAECPDVMLVDWRSVGVAVRRAQHVVRAGVRRFEQGDTSSDEAMALGNALHSIPSAAAALFPPQGSCPADIASGRGAFLSAPPFEANALAATLDAWGRPLTDEQAARLDALYAPFWELWKNSAPPGALAPWPQQLIVTLTKARAELQPRIEAVLEERQLDALWEPGSAGRVGLDPFSGTLLWEGRVFVVEYDETQDVADSLALAALIPSGVSPEEGPARAFAREWFRMRPKKWLRGVRGPLSRSGFVTRDELLPAIDGLPEMLAGARARYTFPVEAPAFNPRSGVRPTTSAPPPDGTPSGGPPPPSEPDRPMLPLAMPESRQATLPARISR